MESPNDIPQCPECGGTLVKKEKEGKAYWACPNWLPAGKGCKGFFWSPGGNKKKSYGGGSSKETIEELKKVNKTLVDILEMVASIVKDTSEG